MQTNGYLYAMRGLLAALLIFSSACASVLSEAVLEQPDSDFPVGELYNDPEKYRGKSIVVGGTIINVVNEKSRSVIELLQRPLGSRLEPGRGDETQGRVLLVTDKTLDDQIFYRGRKLTAAAEISGKETRPLDEVTYTYPVLKIIEYHLWPIEANAPSQPNFSIGIGIFHGF